MNSPRGIFRDHRAVIWTGLLALTLTAVSSAEAFQARVIQFDNQKSAARKQFNLTIFGAVEKPGCYLCQQGKHTLGSLIERAGGAKATAGQTVRIVRGGRAGVVLRYPSQAAFQLQADDIVHLQPAQKTAARVIDFGQMQPAIAGTHSTQVVRPVSHTEENTDKDRGHVVLIGIDNEPIVMPLWTAGLTVDVLLTRYLKQPEAVAARTRLAAGKYPVGRPGELRDGLVLAVPAHLVDRPALPKLPAAIDVSTSEPVKNEAAAAGMPESRTPASGMSGSGLPEMNGGSELKIVPYPDMNRSPAATATPQTAPATNNTPAGASQEQAAVSSSSMPQLQISPAPSELARPATPHTSTVPSLDDLTPIPAKPATPSEDRVALTPQENAGDAAQQESFANELSSFEDMLAKTFASQPAPTAEAASSQAASQPEEAVAASTVPDDLWPAGEFERVLAEKQAAIPHLPGEGEVVPSPMERAEAPAAVSPVGMIAGAIVVIGVLTVIIAAIRAHLFPGALLPEWVESQVASDNAGRTRPEFQPSARTQETQQRQQPQLAPAVSEPARSRPGKKEFAPTRTATETPAASVADIAPESPTVSPAQSLPIVEEPAALPRESTFFGKPQLHYEFRIDGSHEIRRPHIASAVARKTKAEAETKAEKQANPGVDEIIDRFRDDADPVAGEPTSQTPGLTYRNASDYPLDDIDTTDLFAAAYAIQAATTKRSS